MRFEQRLQKANVECIDEMRSTLKCKHCGCTWSPNIKEGGRMPRGYWKCPHCYGLI